MKKFYRRQDGTVWTVSDEILMQDFVPARAGAESASPRPSNEERHETPKPITRSSRCRCARFRLCHRGHERCICADERAERAADVALPRRRQEHGGRQLREQPVPRLGAADQGFERAANGVRDLVACRQACAVVPGAVQRAVAAHRTQSRSCEAAQRGKAMPRLPRAQRAGCAPRRAVQVRRRRVVRGLSRAGGTLARIARAGRRDACRQSEGGAVSDRRSGRARTALPVVPFRQRRSLRDAPDHGGRASADGLRARHVHRRRARAFQARHRLGEAQADVGRRARSGRSARR